MLPKILKITKKEDFAIIYRQSRTFSQGNIVLKIRKNELGHTRIGIVASTKFSRLAVERNRAKRQTRAIFSDLLKSIKPGWDIVVIVRKNEGLSAKIESAELEKMLTEALKKARLIS